MPTKIEPKLELETQDVAQLRAEVARLRKELDAKPKGLTGWLITAPKSNYNGVTMGYRFKNGKAFIQDGEDAAEKVRLICADFNYTQKRVDDFSGLPEQEKEEIKGNMIDILVSSPQVVNLL